MPTPERSRLEDISGGSGPEETPSPITVADIKKMAADLAAKVTAAQAQKEKDIVQRVSEHESLRGAALRNEALLLAAQETLGYFESIKELGELRDPEDLKKLEDTIQGLRQLVATLEQQRVALGGKGAALAGQPEIAARLRDEADITNVAISVEKEIKQTGEQLNPQIDRLAADIKSLAETKASRVRDLEDAEGASAAARQKVNYLFHQTKSMLKKPDFYYVLDKISIEGGPSQKLRQELRAARGHLGWFTNEEKAAVDSILSDTLAFSKLEEAESMLEGAQRQLEAATAEERSLADQYKTIILQAWEAQNRINALPGSQTVRPQASLPGDFSRRLERSIEGFAAERTRSRGGRGFGRSYDIPRQDPGNRTLFDTWGNVTRQAGGNNLIYSNPQEARESK